MKKEITDVVVIGAGPSGVVSASYLHNQGLRVKVLEKAVFPRFSIGESLLPQSMDNFEEAGLLKAIEKGNFQKKFGARFVKDGRLAEFMFKDKYGKGWDWTWQVPRADFDNLLAQEAISKGVEIEFGAEVLEVKICNGESTVKYKDRADEICIITSRFIIDSSGNGRVLARQFNLDAPPKIDGYASIFTHIKDVNRPEGLKGTQITFEIIDVKTWFWYIPFSNGNSSLGFVAHKEWFLDFPENSEKAFPKMLEKLDFYKGRFINIPYLFSPYKVENMAKNVTRLYGDGYVLTGNSAEFLDPIFSSGISFATYSGLLAAKLVTKQLKGEAVEWDKEYVKPIKKGVAVFASYIKEWYSGNLQNIIFHPQPNLEIRKKICAVLAGYVWDESNPFVKNHDRILTNVNRLIALETDKKL